MLSIPSWSSPVFWSAQDDAAEVAPRRRGHSDRRIVNELGESARHLLVREVNDEIVMPLGLRMLQRARRSRLDAARAARDETDGSSAVFARGLEPPPRGTGASIRSRCRRANAKGRYALSGLVTTWTRVRHARLDEHEERQARRSPRLVITKNDIADAAQIEPARAALRPQTVARTIESTTRRCGARRSFDIGSIDRDADSTPFALVRRGGVRERRTDLPDPRHDARSLPLRVSSAFVERV